MPIKSAARFTNDYSFTIRSDLRIGWQELDAVSAMLREVAPWYSADLAGDRPDDRSVVVMPEGADDRLGATFIIHTNGASVQLDQMQWDECIHIATVPTVRHAMETLRSCLLAMGDAAPGVGS